MLKYNHWLHLHLCSSGLPSVYQLWVYAEETNDRYPAFMDNPYTV